MLPVGIEPTTSPLPRECSTTELRQRPGREIVPDADKAITRGSFGWQGQLDERRELGLRFGRLHSPLGHAIAAEGTSIPLFSLPEQRADSADTRSRLRCSADP